MEKCVLILLLVTNVMAWVKEMENPGLYEGDMILSPEQKKQLKEGKFFFSSTNNKNKLWKNAVVPYELSSELKEEREAVTEINEAIAQYERYTCLKFVSKSRKHREYIQFYKGSGCSSRVGVTDGRNRISLAKGCWWRTTIMHEIGHSLGFHHEQSRPDRDQYVTIVYGNIYPGVQFNFRKQTYQTVDSLGSPYDYRSMMHYSWNAFGKNQKMTIKTKDPDQQYEIGQDEGFSHEDIAQINRLYSCSGTYPTLPPYVKPQKDCYNLGGNCAKSAMEGLCNRREWKTYMHSKCRRSCGLCGKGPQPTRGPQPTWGPQTTRKPTDGTGGGDCKDRVIDCLRLGRHRCTSPAVWSKYMKRSCRRYCNLC